MNAISHRQALSHTFARSSLAELKFAAKAQAIGTSAIVVAAIIYGLISFPSPAPTPNRAPASPAIDYQLTPEPIVTPLRGSQPITISQSKEQIQVASALKRNMMSLQLELSRSAGDGPAKGQASLGSMQAEFLDWAGAPTKGAEKLPLSQVSVLSARDLLGWTLDVPSTEMREFHAGSLAAAEDFSKNFISSTSAEPPQFILIVLTTPPEGSKSEPWRPVSLGVVKSGSRLLFIDPDFKVSEVFDSGRLLVDLPTEK
jgi:hypothetical protein